VLGEGASANGKSRAWRTDPGRLEKRTQPTTTLLRLHFLWPGLDYQEFIAFAWHDFGTIVILAEHGVRDDHPARHRQNAEHLQGRFVPVGLGAHPHSRQYGLDLRSVRRLEVLPWETAFAAAAEGLVK